MHGNRGSEAIATLRAAVWITDQASGPRPRSQPLGNWPQMWIVDPPLIGLTLSSSPLLILILSPLVILRTPTDIFPNINIPVVAVAWIYTGLMPKRWKGG